MTMLVRWPFLKINIAFKAGQEGFKQVVYSRWPVILGGR
jgi:hypothetical protein